MGSPPLLIVLAYLCGQHEYLRQHEIQGGTGPGHSAACRRCCCTAQVMGWLEAVARSYPEWAVPAVQGEGYLMAAPEIIDYGIEPGWRAGVKARRRLCRV